MITVAAILNIRDGQSAEFEAAFRQAAPLIATAPGYLGHELHRCLDTPGRYLVLEHWQTRDAHMLGFRQAFSHCLGKSPRLGIRASFGLGL